MILSSVIQILINRLYIFEQQQSQSEEQLIAEAIRKTFEGLIEINKIRTQTCYS
jgi:hypothetical protein